MTRAEVQKLLATISVLFPNFKAENKTLMVDAWSIALNDYDSKVVSASLNNFIATSGSAFPPSIPQIIEGCRVIAKMDEPKIPNEAEAWGMVRKAIGRGNYYARDDFDAFPEPVKRAVDSWQQIMIWAQDDRFNEGVESSNFKKLYTEVVKEQEHKADLRIAMTNALQIGVSNE